jgi:hypothetical protein
MVMSFIALRLNQPVVRMLHGSWMVSGWDSLPILPESARDTLHASYLHLHWAGYPELAQRFANAVHDHARTMRPEPAAASVGNRAPAVLSQAGAEAPASASGASNGQSARRSSSASDDEVGGSMRALREQLQNQGLRSSRQAGGVHDLYHHGDQDVAEGLIDLAVNVRLSAPPEWLSAIINSTTQDLAEYPNPDAASKAISEAHAVGVDQVLPTSGGAEAFTLIARAFHPQRPVIVHPPVHRTRGGAFSRPATAPSGTSCRPRLTSGSRRRDPRDSRSRHDRKSDEPDKRAPSGKS